MDERIIINLGPNMSGQHFFSRHQTNALVNIKFLFELHVITTVFKKKIKKPQKFRRFKNSLGPDKL